MAQRVIPSLAILKVNFDEGQDYIDNFVPFIAECLRSAPQPEVSLAELQASVTDSFGLSIPQGALNTILTRAARTGYVERSQGILRRNDSALAHLDLPKKRDDVLRQYEALIDKVISFCRERFRVEWTPEQADSALLSYLEEGSSAVLSAALGEGVVPSPDEDVADSNFLINAFVAHVHERDPEGFAFLETIVKGRMLSEVLLYPDIGTIGRRFDKVEVYFDTAFILQALGHEGESRQAPRIELLELLYEENARLAVFDHTVDEIRRVLQAAVYALRNPQGVEQWFGVFRHFYAGGYTPSDVELIIAKLEGSIAALRIKSTLPPPYTEELTVDELNLGSVLQDWVQYQRGDARQHDVASVAAIHRLRRGEIHGNVESCRAIFATTNSVMARAVRRFFRDEYKEYREGAVSHCIVDHYLTTLVWLKKPMRAPDLPRKRIIANCYAAMNPPDHLWKRYLREIERLQKRGDISAEDYYLLRYSSEASNALMDTTLGGSQPFTEGTVAEVLESARAAARADVEAALEDEKVARMEGEKQAGIRLQEAEARVEEAHQQADAARASAEAHRQAQLDRIRATAARSGAWVARAVKICGLLLISAIVFLVLFLPALPGGLWLPFVVAALVFFGVGTVANMAFGETLISFSRRIEIATSERVERTLRRLLSLD